MIKGALTSGRPDGISLPQGWTTARIGDVLRLINGAAFKPSDWTQEGLPIVRIQNLNNPEAPFNRYAGELNARFRLRNGDLLFAWSGTPGTSFGAHIWNGGDGWLNQHIFRVEFDPSLFDTEFLRLAINRNLQEYISEAHGGAGLAHITKGRFEAFSIVVPPLGEQQRIVERLRKLQMRVHRSRTLLQNVAISLDQTRQSLLAAAMRGDLTAGWRERHPDTPQWSTTTVGEQLVSLKYGTAAKCTPTTKGVPVLRIPNVVTGTITAEDLKFGTLEKSEREMLALRSGDVLMVRSNGSPTLLGVAALVTEKFEGYAFAGYLLRLRPKETVVSSFLLYVLRSPVIRDIIETKARSSAGVNNINSDEVKSLPLPLPCLAEQYEIVRRLDVAFSHLNAAAEVHAKALQDLRRLEHSLLVRALSGTLVAQDPADEPAEAAVRRATTGAAKRPSFPTEIYLIQLAPALLRAVGHSLLFDQLNAITALLFLRNQFLPLVESIGGSAAVNHFADFAQPNQPGALLNALIALGKAGAVTHSELDGGVMLHLNAAKLPPIHPTIEADARYLAAIIALVPPAVARASRASAQPERLREALLTVP